MPEDQRTALRCSTNWLAPEGLGPFAEGHLKAIREAGYDGVQFTDLPNLDQSRVLVRIARECFARAERLAAHEVGSLL